MNRAIGIDLSKGNYPYNYDKSEFKHDFAILRAANGYKRLDPPVTGKDSKFDKHLESIMKVAVKGAYHYFRSADAARNPLFWKRQADEFLEIINEAEQRFRIKFHLFACDFEAHKGDNVFSSNFAKGAKAWIDYVQKETGRLTVLYTNKAFYHEGLFKMGQTWQRDYPLWIAQYPYRKYHSDLEKIPLGESWQPSLPAGHTGWLIWQYAANPHGLGLRHGIQVSARRARYRVDIDVNVFNGDRQKLLNTLKIDPGTLEQERVEDKREELPEGREKISIVTGEKPAGLRKGITTGNVILRAGPSRNFKALKYLVPNTDLEVLDEKVGWMHVKYRGLEGYVGGKYVDIMEDSSVEVIPQPKTDVSEPAHEDDTPSSTKVSRTTDRLNFRRTPEIPHPNRFANVIETLNPGTVVKIIGEQGVWLKVLVDETEGYVHRDYITVSDVEEVTDQFIPTSDANIIQDFEPITIKPTFDWNQRRIANTWNNYGDSVIKYSKDMGVDTDLLFGVMMGVLIAEAGGSGFRNGKLLIRFEVHLFYDYWGKNNKKLFDRHFNFNRTGRRWEGHTWRRRKKDPWKAFHNLHWSLKNDAEWEVFNFAKGFNSTAAYYSTSFGMPQILGSNFRYAGFSSPNHMVNAFIEDEKYHIEGFLSYLKNRRGIPEALRGKDFGEFARRYNGSGQVDKYKTLILGPMDTLQELRAL